jgi:hypothetical protein
VETINGSKAKAKLEMPRAMTDAIMFKSFDGLLCWENRASNRPSKNPRKFISTAMAMHRMNHGTMTVRGM